MRFSFQLQRRHRTAGRSDAIEDLKTAFETAEQISPGVSDAFLRDLFKALAPRLNSTRLTEARENLLR